MCKSSGNLAHDMGRCEGLELALETERRRREMERHASTVAREIQDARIENLKSQIREANRDKLRLQRTIPRYVITAVAAVLAIIVPSVLQKLSVIGPQLAYAMECVLFMVATWCAAIVWERARK